MKKGIKIVVSLLILLGLIYWCYTTFFSTADEVSYITERVRIGTIKRTVNTSGEVGPVQLVTVGAQVSGQITKLYVKLGQKIKKGDKIADIDSIPQLNELNINKARLETYKAQLVSKEIALRVAQKKYNREKNLKKHNATSDENLEAAEDALAAARASVADMKSQVVQAQIEVNNAETNLGYTKITAPLDGTIVSTPIEEGQTVNSNQTTPTIVKIADLSKMEIKMQISEGDITKIQPNMEVSYTILSEPNNVYRGKLDRIDPGLISLTKGDYNGSTEANTAVYYYANVIVPNEENKLRIGMTTQNTITIASAENVLLVPKVALKGQGDNTYVDVLEADGITVNTKKVKIGLTDNINAQVIAGLQEGEQVITMQMTSSEMYNKAMSSMQHM
ncbi:efflux RND transporter periplasmic adaptor subunit [Entomomonas asaccharolytica]|uniref:Efflux RND transporter periplasmic adaptor subunit n=1 Tax=Entomomonas asaccharolytica TaxID=2785331 RepID=A0A974NH15_9GAMM|nr:efflux RND transporter periplasmic adaptor subunit [Entomomonas asaccharolytica]QQP86476.1 efflux RND transporter periplasmic adaptor subunit [Entomomonas asaccharolytica]